MIRNSACILSNLISIFKVSSLGLLGLRMDLGVFKVPFVV